MNNISRSRIILASFLLLLLPTACVQQAPPYDIIIQSGQIIDGSGNPWYRATWTKPHQYPTGIDYVIVNGKLVVDNGKWTEVFPGKVLHGPGKE